MKTLLRLGASLAALSFFGHAQAQDQALVVSSCGSPSVTYPAGQIRMPTVDTNGKLCLSITQVTPGGASGQVQWNNNNVFGGITGATTDGTALTLVAPVLGTPTSLVGTNITGTATGLTAGNVSGTGIGSLASLALGGAALGTNSLIVQGVTGGGGAANGISAVTLLSGTGATDGNLTITKASSSLYGIKISDNSTIGSTGNEYIYLSNVGSPSVLQKNAYMNQGAFFTRTGITVAGHFTSDGGINSAITPPTLDPTMISLWGDVGGPMLQARVANATGTYLYSGIDRNANYVTSMREDGSIQWGAATSFTASMSGTVMTVTVAPTGNTLAAGQTVTGVAVLDDTVILSQASGSAGSTGDYNISRSQTVASRIMSGMDSAMGRRAAASFRFGFVDSANPIGQTIGFQNGSGTNIAAVNTTLDAPLGTGTGTNGDWIFRTGVKVGSGTGAPTKTEAVRIKGETQVLELRAGGNSVHQLLFTPNSGTDMSIGSANGGSGLIVFSASGANQSLGLLPQQFVLPSTGRIAWTNNASNVVTTQTTNISQISAGLLGIGLTGAGQATGSLNLTNLTGTGTIIIGTGDAASSTGGALQVTGGASIAKRFWIPAITASAGLQTAVLCQSSGGEMIADSVACLASSERAKEEIHPSDMGLNVIMALKPVTYRYRLTGNDRFDSAPNQRAIHAGFSAEQAASVDPRLVAYDSNGNVRTIRPDAIPAALVLAFQQMQAELAIYRRVLH